MSPVDSKDLPMANSTRRSGRSKNPPLKYDEEYMVPSDTPSKQKPATRTDRPKRNSVEAELDQIVPEKVDALQEQVFARMDIEERKEYHGWVELESEPAFFNAMLQDLNAKDLKVQEVVGLDEMLLAGLPKPVYGLIFLYEWTNEDESDEARQDCPKDLWFGNQTTANACATVALMNIIMNIHDVKLGPELEEFRNMTQTLPPPHRGHALDTNDFIRVIHNSVARRNDLVSEDLLLENMEEVAYNKRRNPPAAKKKKKTSRPAKRTQESGTYHYIAIVPVNNQVWELDGLETKPLCLGQYTTSEAGSWLKIACEAIRMRMGRQRNEFLSYNLLAICQSPLLAIIQELATNLATAKAFDDVVGNDASWDGPRPWDHFSDERLARFDLTREKILAEYAPKSALLEAASGDRAAAQELARELCAQQDALEAMYIGEMATVEGDVGMIRARQRDYTPAMHQWLRLLSEKGVLRELIKDMDVAD